jgi:ABC-type sugar transport system ATPase subunit
MSVHVELTGVAKRFGGVQALRGVDLRIERGRVHALVGENGAGKSTLGRVIAGGVVPDAGEIHVGGERVEFRSPRDALRAGITGIAQELALVPARSVVENVFLGVEAPGRLGRVPSRELRARYEALTAEIGFELPARALVRELSISERQKVEILRAVARNAELVVFDEPTAALGAHDTEQLLSIVRRLVERGTSVVYVSHFLREVLGVADTITVLKDGARVRTAAAKEETEESLVTAMLGRPLTRRLPARCARKTERAVALDVDGLRVDGTDAPVSLQVSEGEMVGIAGLVGSGRSELLQAIYGAHRVRGGVVRVAGKVVSVRSPRDGLRCGMSLLPESRKDQGLLMGRSTRENITLPHIGRLARAGVIRRRAERSSVTDVACRVALDDDRVTSAVSTLSGGNQQKALFARCLVRPPVVLLADEPTRGVDIGAKDAIYELLHELVASGMAILFVSSDIDEILALSDRVLVMRAGRIAAELTGEDINEDRIMRSAFAGAPTATLGATP